MGVSVNQVTEVIMVKNRRGTKPRTQQIFSIARRAVWWQWGAREERREGVWVTFWNRLLSRGLSYGWNLWGYSGYWHMSRWNTESGPLILCNQRLALPLSSSNSDFLLACILFWISLLRGEMYAQVSYRPVIAFVCQVTQKLGAVALNTAFLPCGAMFGVLGGLTLLQLFPLPCYWDCKQ